MSRVVALINDGKVKEVAAKGKEEMLGRPLLE